MTNELTTYNGGAVTAYDDGAVMSAPGPSAAATRGTAGDEAVFQDLTKANVVEARSLPGLKRWYGDYVARLQAAEDEIDEADGNAGRRMLQAEWGASYAANVARVRQFVNTQLPEPLAHVIWNERDADGHMLANNPGVLRFLLNLSQGGGTLNAGAIEREIAEIETVMRTQRSRYNRDFAMQARLRELYQMRGPR